MKQVQRKGSAKDVVERWVRAWIHCFVSELLLLDEIKLSLLLKLQSFQFKLSCKMAKSSFLNYRHVPLQCDFTFLPQKRCSLFL